MSLLSRTKSPYASEPDRYSPTIFSPSRRFSPSAHSVSTELISEYRVTSFTRRLRHTNLTGISSTVNRRFHSKSLTGDSERNRDFSPTDSLFHGFWLLRLCPNPKKPRVIRRMKLLIH